MRKTLNYHCLEALDACTEQVALFRKTFGAGDIFVSTRDMVKARAAGLSWQWLANTLSASARAEYDRVRASAYDKACASALAEYDKACAPAWAEYNEACAPAWAEYNKVRASALAEYDKACASARAEYNKACASARAEYNKVRASALAEYDKVCAPARAEYDKVRATALVRIWRGDVE
jgi:hypothetical protein